MRAALIVALAGAASRFTLRTVETRWQIVAFWGVVLGYQLMLRPLAGRRVSPASTVLDLTVVAVAITAMKLAIEGHL